MTMKIWKEPSTLIKNENISFVESRLSSDTGNHVLLDERMWWKITRSESRLRVRQIYCVFTRMNSCGRRAFLLTHRNRIDRNFKSTNILFFERFAIFWKCHWFRFLNVKFSLSGVEEKSTGMIFLYPWSFLPNLRFVKT